MKEQAILALAAYFTGPDVAFHSINLGVEDGPMNLRERAKRFFEVRRILGVTGYMDFDESKVAIYEVLESNTK